MTATRQIAVATVQDVTRQPAWLIRLLFRLGFVWVQTESPRGPASWQGRSKLAGREADPPVA